MKNYMVLLLSVFALFACNEQKNANVVDKENKIKSTTEEKKAQKKKSVLFVITSHDELGNSGEKTGVWLEEFVAPYYFLKDKGVDITIASPKGGRPPIDPRSELPEFHTEESKRFTNDKEAQKHFSSSIKLAMANQNDYDGVFYSGGYGPLWDLSEDKTSVALIEDFYKNNKPIATVCHGPIIFKNAKDADGKSLIAGKKVTAYSNSEESVNENKDALPFSVEDELRNNQGIYSQGQNWTPYALEDGLIVTGQNPYSSKLVAGFLFEKM